MAKKKVIIKEKPEETPVAEIEPKATKKKTTGKKVEEEKVVEEAFKVDEEEINDEELTQVEKDIREVESSEFDEQIETERIYTINLFKGGVGGKPLQKRTTKAVRVLKKFIMRHMKAGEEASIYIHPEVNHKVWARGIRKPPRKVRVRTTKSTDGIVRVYLA